MNRIRSVSKKRAAENRRRRALIARMQEDGRPSCVNCGAPAEDLHELLSRARGGSITDPANCVPICRLCHDRVTTEPVWAAELGLSRRKE